MHRIEKKPLFSQQRKVEVLSNRHIKANYYKLTFETPFSFSEVTPGQFVHIRVRDTFSPLLRRPFSISNALSKRIEIIYKVVGQGTNILSKVKRGDCLSILGPVGNGFSISKEVKEHILIGGGIGVSPLVFLARKIAKTTKNKNCLSVFLGFKTADEILCQNELVGANIALYVATEDGSHGYKGLVHHLVEDYLKKLSSFSGLNIYACGPSKMLKFVADLSFNYAIFSQVLMEEIIGCGVGVCRGCVVKGKAGYLRVCQEGPVFDAKEIIWT